MCDLAAGIKMGESAVSQQLQVLKSMQMVNYRKEGRNVYYSLADSEAISLDLSISTPFRDFYLPKYSQRGRKLNCKSAAFANLTRYS